MVICLSIFLLVSVCFNIGLLIHVYKTNKQTETSIKAVKTRIKREGTLFKNSQGITVMPFSDVRYILDNIAVNNFKAPVVRPKPKQINLP